MAKQCVINVDLAGVFDKPVVKGRKLLTTLAWGDHVEVVETTDTHLRINTVHFEEQDDGSILPIKTEAFIVPPKSARKADGSKLKPADVVIPKKDNAVLKVNFVDVQQGDGTVIESPDGRIILLDGGDNQLFARYLAARFRGTSEASPKEIDCILVTHGDADHFAGLTKIHASETNPEPKKRLFITPKRVYHNGLVKRPSKDGDGNTTPKGEMLGPSKVVDGDTIITGLADSLLDVPDKEMNLPFRQWKEALTEWNSRSEIEFRRLSFGDDDAFDFFKEENLEISVLGPFLTKKGNVTGLKFLGTPPKGPRIGHESMSLGEDDFKGLDPSHTINGHSVVLRLRYGGFSYLFTGDLNDESGRILARKNQSGEINLRSEVFKVPHHGSADFSGAFFQMVSPIISVVSSGDESAKKEYVHPRATLMGALGKHSRVEEPLIFVTELVAFFNLEGNARLTDKKKDEKRGEFFSFSRTAFGIVKTRTDGHRMLVYTDSGKDDMKEAYAYTLDENGLPVPSPVVKV
ncbi:MAG TPA: MBL fold metallo-hydrolase [Planctomycetaceae bacterium]|nr:MBL fold metallo-hydrolase [Planctomycetaceae bacterium]